MCNESRGPWEAVHNAELREGARAEAAQAAARAAATTVPLLEEADNAAAILRHYGYGAAADRLVAAVANYASEVKARG